MVRHSQRHLRVIWSYLHWAPKERGLSYFGILLISLVQFLNFFEINYKVYQVTAKILKPISIKKSINCKWEIIVYSKSLLKIQIFFQKKKQKWSSTTRSGGEGFEKNEDWTGKRNG